MRQLVCDMYDDIFTTNPFHEMETRLTTGFLALTMVIDLGLLVTVLASATSKFLGH